MSLRFADKLKQITASEVAMRSLSALVLVPIVLLLVCFSAIGFSILVGFGAALVFIEWQEMTSETQKQAVDFSFFAPASIFLVLCSAIFLDWTSFFIALVFLLGLFLGSLESSAARFWRMFGLFYSVLGGASLIYLITYSDIGSLLVLAILVTVWMTDAGAYFVGRRFGGPKLMPTVSPNKTWSGALGGLIFGAVSGGLIYGWFSIDTPLLVLIFYFALLSIAGQAGDLVQSALKRHFDIKDTGALIPGHGGVMDRVDSLIFVSICCVCAVFLFT